MSMSSPVENFPCFHHVIQYWAQKRPDTVAFYYLPDGEKVATSLSYAELDRQARLTALMLQQQGLSKQPVLLQFRPGIDFIVAFFGCLYAGVIAVSAYPPGNNRSKSDRLQKLIASSQATTILTNHETLDDVRRESEADAFALRCIEDAQRGDVDAWWAPALTGEDIAFLQYSSGSTGDPKGVIVTHANLMSNQCAIRQGMGNGDHTVFASWLPLFHDMGLIGNVMQPLYLGVSCWLMPPMAFLQKPVRWLRLISDAGVTCSGGPDFAYALCVNNISEEERAGLDLSRWDVAYNGAEPIRSETVARFQAAYAHYGLRHGALYPCYGLAEATLFVSGNVAGQPATTLHVDSERLSAGVAQLTTTTDGTTLVSSGQLWGGTQLIIADPERRTRCADGRVGEIWLRGDSISRGYWNASEANATLLAALADDAETSYLRTGDLGFLRDGQLYVTGRLKDVLIVRGRNHYPQDIEYTVQSSDSQFVTGGGVAFMSGDELVVVQEVRRSAVRRFDAVQALEQARSAVAGRHGLTLAHLVAVKPGSVAKTSSGKLRRRYMCSQWQAGNLAPLGLPCRSEASDARSSSALFTLLAAKGLSPQPRHTLSMLGVDSLLRLELHTLLQQRLARTIPLDWLLADLTLEKLEQQLAALPAMETVPEEEPPVENAAVTPWQQAIWLHQQTQPDASCYNLATFLTLSPHHSPEQVQQTLDLLSAAHPQLAATLTDSGWLSGAGVKLECVDASDWTSAQRSAWLLDFRARPFDLTVSPAWRCALLTGQGQGVQLALAVHHMIIDHMAAQTLLHDLRQLLAGEQCLPAASRLPLMLGSLHSSARPDLQADAGWLDALCAMPERPDFNLAKPVQPAALASVRHTLAAAETQALKQYAQQAGTTLHVLLAAAFAALLARYSGETRLALGIPVSVRAPQQARWLGNAVNILPLALHVDDDTTLKTLLEQVSSHTHLLLRHRFLPYISLLEQVRRRQPQRDNLYHAVFACQSEQPDCPPFIPAAAAQSQFSLLAFPSPQQIVLELEFDPLQCDSHSAQRLLAHLQQWLHEALLRPDIAIGQICYLSLAEQAEMGLLTRPVTPQLSHQDVISRFRRQAALSPDATAVEDASGACSYAQLLALAQGYTALLQHQHVRPGERIGLAMTRDRHLPAAMLAIHAAGACYVPMDLSYPPDRLAMMMEDSQCRIVMARDPALFPEHHVITPVDLRPEVSRPLVAASLDAIAYVLYTSGSTGRPKGVQVTQGNISALLDWAQTCLSDRERARILASTSICFDLSVFECFVPLCLGTCCVIVERILDLAERSLDVSLVNTVPSAVEALLQAGAFPLQAQVALVAGEPFRQTLVDRLLSQAPLLRLLDLYGPTEDTVYSTCARRYAGGDETIGTPLPGTRAYVLDSVQQPVAQNMPGELWLAGEKLSQGYLQRPELNAAAFTVPAALRHLETRAYRTGDRVRRLADGRLVYLGRLDHQIKLNGYRIETGEVERCLLRAPGIQQAVVSVVENATGQKQLAAWYVPAGEEPGSGELRRQLAKTLPEWMLPSAWLALPTLPQTPNGKIDRRALPLPAFGEKQSQPLQREDEQQLADIWQQVLGQRPQNREAHFISLGGNSLLVVQLRQQLSRYLNVEVPIALLLNHRAFGEQADALAGWLQQAQSCDDIEEISL
ncbi:amino acid adenylation domain-containing protein [Dickeya poaceiphila]|uniref:Amino acid adenylation domain-containing protein n=2 Tax=Dickeya poaceiphila TaxID=568768 RepID=A0A5B8IAV0_9GAMM|nr:amino acid adenylation domain-containing protein [Dickeya poaceiphila]